MANRHLSSSIVLQTLFEWDFLFSEQGKYWTTEETKEALEFMLSQMREIDLRGSFESDDEVGSVFTQLKTIIEVYNNIEQDIEQDA